MVNSHEKTSDEFARVVWASHILSYLNPYTITTLDEIVSSNQQSTDHNTNDDEEEELGDDSDLEQTSVNNQLLTIGSETIREKFLNCICDILSHTKGPKFVTAAALREKENSIEIDLARNDGFDAKDDEYLSSLARFLAIEDKEISRQEVVDYYHSFLDRTIEYNSNRVDYWVEKTVGMLKGSPYRSVPHLSKEDNVQGTCLLGCCSEVPVKRTATTQLLLNILNYGSRKSGVPTKSQQENERRDFVMLAGDSMRSPEDTLADLKAMVPSANHLRIMNMWRLLARPATNLHILSQIARLLPQFRSVTFVKLPIPAPVKLQKHQTPKISTAWKYLGLPSISTKETYPASNKRFTSDCSRSFPTHCEIQLLMRYEREPLLAPTLDFFGCSKKACFLCDTFLEISSLRFRVRGRHGTCHPLWGVHMHASQSARPRLIKLCEVIVKKIENLLEPEVPSCVLIQQSSAVSQIKSEDMVDLTRQNRYRERLDKSGQDYREKMSILLNPRSIGPQQIFYADARTLCVMCQSSCAKRCTRCYSSWYCSQRCQELDWPSHKLLCSRYVKNIETRPSDNYRLGIWFPRDMEKPRLVWAPFRDYMGSHYPKFDSFLGPNHGVFYTIIINENKRRGMELDHILTLYYRDYDEMNSKSIHHTVEACHGLTVPYSFPGDYVVMCGRHYDSVEVFGDMTLADFRHVQDYFSTSYDETIRETPSGGSVLAVQINCALEQRLYARDTFASVAVDRDFMATTSALSPISEHLGNSIRICKLDCNELKREGERMDLSVEEDFRNPYANILLTEMDPASENWGKCIEISQFDGNVILLSQDRADLTVELVQTMAGYCLEILKSLFEKSMERGISRREVLAEISPEKMMSWKSAEVSQDTETLLSRRGFVARIGSSTWNLETRVSPVLDIVDKFFRAQS